MRKRLVVAMVLVLAAGATGFALTRDREPPSQPEVVARADRTFDTNDPIERACRLDPEYLVRIDRGYDVERSEDVTIVPQSPNFAGSFDVTSHTGPWDYVQRVPLIVYGPRRIGPGRFEEPVTLADVYPTVGALTGIDLPERDGSTLPIALSHQGTGAPAMIVTVVWDGVGTNVLERWPEAWPNLERLATKGASFSAATVGSSPSITPATHSTLGTGAFPNIHRVPAIQFRAKDGEIHEAFAARNPSILAIGTYADRIDKELGNDPLVGLVAWQPWHLGMLGHGTSIPAGDADHLALIEEEGGIKGGNAYATPAYLNSPEIDARLTRRVEELDRADGAADGRWRGRDIREEHGNPAWVEFEADVILELWKREGYGADTVTDLFLTNFKATDLIGHSPTMDSPEMEEVLHAQDAALGRLVEYLDREAKDYVLIVTADHGSTPRPETTGAWPIDQIEVVADVDDRFGIKGEPLIEQTSAAGYFIDPDVAAAAGVTDDQVARFLNDYRLADNWNGSELPEAYRDRSDENVLAAAWPSDRIAKILECAGLPPSPSGS